MRQSLQINAFRLLNHRKHTATAIWDKAEPVSIDSLAAELATLTSKLPEEKQTPNHFARGTESLEDLWEQIETLWEQLEDIDDCRVVY